MLCGNYEFPDDIEKAANDAKSFFRYVQKSLWSGLLQNLKN